MSIYPEIVMPVQEIKRRKILRAALSLLAHKGFHGFSIKEVAKVAEVATGTVYVYFRDKHDMIGQLHMDIIRSFAKAAFLGWDESASPYSRYKRLCSNLWHYSLSHKETVLCKGQFDQLPPDVLRIQYADAQRFFEPLNILFNEGKANGELIPLPNEVLSSVTVETIWQVAYKQILGMINVREITLDKIIEVSWCGVSRSHSVPQ